MQLAYSKFQSQPNPAFPDRKHVKRPVIPVGVKYNGNEIKYLALIDSGADFCIFHAQIGEAIGIDIKKGKVLEYYGITGEKEEAFFHDISIIVGGWEKKCYCGFSYKLDKSKMPYGVLGQKGFFNLFKVSMDYEKEQIELKPKELSNCQK